jgi:spermidine synthase
MLKRLLIGGLTGAAALLAPAAPGQESRFLLEARESLYNNIYVYEQSPYVSMTFGFNKKIYVETVYNQNDDRELPLEYSRYMTAGVGYASKVNSVLEIGFGGGRIAWYLHRFMPDASITSVELDPAVVELARKYFGIKDEPKFDVVSRDGRIFLASSKERYDLILIDAFRGPYVPFHLMTKEFYQLVKDHLAEGGVVAQNIDPSTMLFDSTVKTTHEVFPNMDFYLSEPNVVMIAYGGAARSLEDLGAAAGARQASLRLRYDIRDMLGARKHFDPDNPGIIDPQAKILTDDFAPVESLKAIERHNRKWPDTQ